MTDTIMSIARVPIVPRYLHTKAAYMKVGQTEPAEIFSRRNPVDFRRPSGTYLYQDKNHDTNAIGSHAEQA